jgi:hypothetical protein
VRDSFLLRVSAGRKPGRDVLGVARWGLGAAASFSKLWKKRRFFFQALES